MMENNLNGTTEQFLTSAQKISESAKEKSNIKGLHKLTLIDYPGKIACSIFFYGCNFRCGFCHNPELVLEARDEGEIVRLPDISRSEILDFLRERKKYLDGVCITGGEPLLNIDLDFLKQVKDMGYLIKIDTNGSMPEKLQEIINAKLVDFIAMDIKAPKEKYSSLINVNFPIGKIEESIRIVSSFPAHEFRTTILHLYHSPEDLKSMMEWITALTRAKIKKFSLQGFKNNGKLIDEGLYSESHTAEKYLEELKKVCELYCNEVEVRV